MRKAGSVLLLVLALVALATAKPGFAQGCHIEPMPAATLLLPYFEIDLNSATGMTTAISINNAATHPVLAKVEFWSDLGVAIFGFMVYLKADDVQTIALRDLLLNGTLPPISPAAGTFPSCVGAPTSLSPSLIFNYQRALTGKSVDLFGGTCAGRNFNDNIARGYITVDAVNACTTLYQNDVAAFGPGGSGIFTNQNVLWGDYFYSNAGLNQAEGHPLVHIVADSSNPLTSAVGKYTFYGKYVNWAALDNRVPLATNFAVRYANSGGMASDLVVWRDSKVASGTFACGSLPSWYPLGQTRITALDEDDHAVTLTTNAFPAVAQRVHVGGSALPTPWSFGWFSLDLNTLVPTAGNVPPADPRADQAWITMTMTSGSLGLGEDVIRLDNACNARHTGL